MATSQVAWGKVELAARAGRKLPLTWATDREGRPTDDPTVALHGLMQPLGGYKGYGLALMLEILCGVLSGAAFGPHLANFYSQLQQMVDQGKVSAAQAAPLLEGAADILEQIQGNNPKRKSLPIDPDAAEDQGGL